MAVDKPNPSNLSGDFASMQDDWKKVEHLFGGIKALRANASTYLPVFPEEPTDVYDLRKQLTKLTNIYSDIVENLAARPFADPVVLSDEIKDEEIWEFSEDVDAQGRSLHEFASESFYNAVGYAVDWIVVDYTEHLPAGNSVADERRAGVRPFWRRYTAVNALAVYSTMIDGEEQFTHARFREYKTVRVDFKEEMRERVRVWDRELLGDERYGPPTVALWEKQDVRKNGRSTGEKEWVLIQEPRPISLEIIPVVPVLLGRRKGASWKLHLPMREAADLQIEHFQQDSALKYARTMSAFPVLAGNGIAAPQADSSGNVEKLVVGPNSILYAPPSAAGGATPYWEWIEPSAESLTFLQSDIKDTATELRELGRQPLTTSMSNITVITSAVAGSKGQAAVQTWATAAKKAFERCLYLTALWMKKPDLQPLIVMNLDFDLSWTEDDGFDHILKLRETGDISRTQTIHEAKRRKIIDKDYDPDKDLQTILDEIEDDGTQDVDPPPPPPLDEDEEEDAA